MRYHKQYQYHQDFDPDMEFHPSNFLNPLAKHLMEEKKDMSNFQEPPDFS